MFQKLNNLINYTKVFPSYRDIQSYRRVAYQSGTEAEVVRVRGMGDIAFRIRPKTSDAAVLWDTFFEKYHLPSSSLGSKPVIFDLGANVGYTAADFAQRYPNATIIAVELDKNNYDAAQINLQPFSNCRLVNAAVWSEDGTVSYDSGEEEWGFHVNNDLTTSGGATAAAKTVLTIMNENNIETIDYVKMDIEGAEWPVLSSGDAWLRKIKSMKIELHPKFNSSATYENCADILNRSGFLCRRDDRHWNTLVAVRN